MSRLKYSRLVIPRKARDDLIDRIALVGRRQRQDKLGPRLARVPGGRLRQRATESSGAIEERIQTAKQQLELQGQFDFVVENDDRERAADALAAIIAQELNGAATMAAQ